MTKLFSRELDNGVYQYYHPEIKRSCLVYIPKQRIELLESNRIAETLSMTTADYSDVLEIARTWVFKT